MLLYDQLKNPEPEEGVVVRAVYFSVKPTWLLA